ncbi:MAG TPA: translocation/assembly module TamB domain-containing protein [Terracidiphilus sp.]|nr:translocation/assembly module TamB domain-containing protein [Terracidiphilus sp.]
MSRGDKTPDGAAAPRRPSRLRRFFLRHVPLTIAGGAALLLVALTGFYFWASSAQCERLVRRWLVAKVEAATGGRVEIASFEWHLLRLEADAGGVTVHGREGAGEAPYAEIGNLRVQLSVLGLVSPHVELRELDVERPSLHLTVYPDGTTNVPTPARKRRPGKPMVETLFDAKAGRVSIEDGTIDYDNRAAAFDFQNRYAPLDLRARDVSVVLGYAPATRRQAESYRIEVGATDLSLVRGGPRSKAPVGHGRLQAVVDLARTAAYLRRLELVTWEGKGARQKLEITGQMEDFAHPHWQAKARGDLDMALFDPATGFPYTPEGVAHVELTGAGADGQFRADGSVHVEDGSYIGTGVRAQGVRLDARVHADASELMISRVVARLRQGGEIDGTVALMHWLPPVPGAAVMAPADPEIDLKVTPRAATRRGRREGARGKAAAPEQTFVRAKPLVIPVDGKVRAEFKRVSLDTILDMVSEPPFQRLGIDAAVNGTATAAWAKGDPRSVQVSAQLNLSPSGAGAPGENPARGVVDATYTQRDGAVNLRELSLAMPGTRLEAKGHLGAYPVTSPTAVALDFESSNLADFDTVLRALGLHRDGKAGVAALPVSLAGQASFRGTWTGSLVQPRIGGVLQATQLGVEMPAAAGGQPRLVHFDSAEATGSYAAARISIQQAVLERGAARLDVSGTLDAQGGGPGERTGFGADSEIHAQMEATKVAVSDLQPFVVAKLPVTGTLDAQLSVGGPLQAPNGSGWVELNGGSLYGEPVKRARVQGSLENRILHLTSAVLSEPAGSVSGSGSYDLKSRQFQAKAAGAGIDVGRVAWFRRHGLEATGKLWFTASGSGTPEAPQLAGDAVLNGLTLSGQPVGGLQLTARTENRMLKFNATTRLEGAELTLNGQTELSGGLATQATAKFSEFNIAALLQQAHVEGLTGESSLAGTISLDGPLRDPAAMRGEAQLKELAVTLAGVHLKSEGGLHATLADGTIHLDPLHVTGEDTDLHAQGTMELNGARRMDFSGNGAINLKLAETLDPDVTAAGETTFEVRAHGPLKSPNLEGRIDFQNGSLSLGDIPNGLSQLHGTLVFNENRLEVRSLTAMSGGGLLSVGGYLAYQHGIFADLSVTGKGIRIRYPPGISSLADTTLRLEGPERNLLLTGNVLITRFTVSPDLDVAALAVQANAAVEKVAPPEAPSNHIRLDVHIVSSPQLNFQNAYAKLAGDVNLRVRGTVANPSLLGRVSLTEGAATIAGTRYELQHGEITFTNPVRIEPNVDMSATARVDDYDVTLEVHGTPPDRMTVNYRSDPPLPETDVISLLALGHTQNQERLYTQQQQQSLTNPTTDALLGGALNATVSSRVQKLFGAGSVKIDPNYLGALGNSTSRITVQEQFGRNVTLTYATDVDTTGQQLLQAEFAVNRHVSLVVARDESGVFSMVIKATRRYK